MNAERQFQCAYPNGEFVGTMVDLLPVSGEFTYSLNNGKFTHRFSSINEPIAFTNKQVKTHKVFDADSNQWPSIHGLFCSDGQLLNEHNSCTDIIEGSEDVRTIVIEGPHWPQGRYSILVQSKDCPADFTESGVFAQSIYRYKICTHGQNEEGSASPFPLSDVEYCVLKDGDFCPSDLEEVDAFESSKLCCMAGTEGVLGQLSFVPFRNTVLLSREGCPNIEYLAPLEPRTLNDFKVCQYSCHENNFYVQNESIAFGCEVKKQLCQNIEDERYGNLEILKVQQNLNEIQKLYPFELEQELADDEKEILNCKVDGEFLDEDEYEIVPVKNADLDLAVINESHNGRPCIAYDENGILGFGTVLTGFVERVDDDYEVIEPFNMPEDIKSLWNGYFELIQGENVKKDMAQVCGWADGEALDFFVLDIEG